jgi:hypothetical protein
MQLFHIRKKMADLRMKKNYFDPSFSGGAGASPRLSVKAEEDRLQKKIQEVCV